MVVKRQERRSGEWLTHNLVAVVWGSIMWFGSVHTERQIMHHMDAGPCSDLGDKACSAHF